MWNPRHGRYLARWTLRPVVALAVVVGASWLNAFGPAAVAGNVLGDVVVMIATLGAAVILFFSLDGVFEANPLFAFAALFAFLFAIGGAHEAVERYAFHQRGVLTSCEIVDLDRRVVQNDHGETTSYEVYYDHQLACVAAQITSMTTEDDPAGEVGDRIPVAYDPSDRLDPRPAGTAGDHPAMLRRAGLAFGLGVGLVVAAGSERVNTTVYRMFAGIFRAIAAATDPVARWWRRRRSRRHQ